MARGQLSVLPVVALAAGLSQVSSSVSAGSATEAANVAVMSAAVQQKLSPTQFNEQLPSSTPPDGSGHGMIGLPDRHFPSPWSVEDNGTCFIVLDHNAQALAYIYYEEEAGRRSAAYLLTRE